MMRHHGTTRFDSTEPDRPQPEPRLQLRHPHRPTQRRQTRRIYRIVAACGQDDSNGWFGLIRPDEMPSAVPTARQCHFVNVCACMSRY